MPKLKTKKAIAKRYRLTKSGRLKHSKAGRGHLLSKKSRKRKRFLKRPVLLKKSDKKIKRLLPYGG